MKKTSKILLALLIFSLIGASSPVLADSDLTPPAPSLEGREQVFSDIPVEDEDYWFTKFLQEKDIFKGYPDGTFDKSNLMKRAELMTVVVRMTGVKPSLAEYNNCFPDISGDRMEDQWFVPYVCYAKAQGWISGYENGLFGPSDPATVMESLKIILNSLFKEAIEAQDGFTAAQNTPSWFLPYLTFVTKKNLIRPNDYGSLDPDATRIKLASIIFRSLLTQEQGWEKYEDYLANSVLAQQGKGYLFSQDYPCYDSDETLPDFMTNYIKQEYGIDHLIEEWWDEDETKIFPFFAVNGFCNLKTGGFLLLGGSFSEEKVLKNHRVEFDASGTVTEDETLSCEQGIENSYAQPFSFSMDFINPDSLEILDCNYARDENYVYLDGWYALDDAQPGTFKQLTYPYSTDGTRVYYRDIPIEGADPNDFTILFPKNSPIQYSTYAKSGGVIYSEHIAVRDEVDLVSFQVMDVPDLPLSYLNGFYMGDHIFSYAKDKNTVYSGPFQLNEFDVETFEIVDSSYAKDKNGVYTITDSPITCIPVEGNGCYDVYHLRYSSYNIGADPETFESLYSFYGKDKNTVYADSIPLIGVDPDSVSLLEESPNPFFWLKTNQGIYLVDKLLTQITDPDHLVFIDDHYTKDSVNVFYLEGSDSGNDNFVDDVTLLEETDPNTFKKMEEKKGVNSQIYRDVNHVYFMSHRVETGDLDLSTAKVTGKGTIEDGKGVRCEVSYDQPNDRYTCQ